MARIVVAGAGVCGLGAALMLARDGHDVTVVERDAAEQPDDADGAWRAWERPGVGQFRIGHILLARGYRVLAERCPEVIDELIALGAHRIDLDPPASIEVWDDRADDDRFSTVTARRPVIEQAFANAIDRTDGVTLRRGVPLAGLLTERECLAGVPHVHGVRTQAGEEIHADVVIDAMGRRSQMPSWLADIGASPGHEHSVDSGFAYFGQHLQSDDGSLPAAKAPGLSPFHGYSILTLPGDNGSWFYGVYAGSKDKEMRVLRDREAVHSLLRSCPLHAHWLDGEEIGDVVSMVGVTDRDRRYVIDGAPVVTGMLPVADAWACTNPSLGRGMSIGLDHAGRLQDVLRGDLDDPVELALAWDADTHEHMTPWHETTRRTDQARVAELDAQRQGRDVQPDPDDVGAQIFASLQAALPFDQDAFRMFADILNCLDLPEVVLSRPGAFEHLMAVSAGRTVPEIPGPTRAEFLASVG